VQPLLPQPDLDIYPDKENSGSLFPYLDGTKIQRVEAALRQSDDVIVVRSILRFRLYGSIDSLRLLLLSCKEKRLAFLYTAITNKQCSPQWDQARLVKNIEDVVAPKKMVSVHKDGFDNVIVVLRRRKPNEIASALLDTMCGRLREVPFKELVQYFIGHAPSAVYGFMNSCDKLIESLQKMFGENSQLIDRYMQVSDLLHSSRHPFAAFVKVIIDYAIHWSPSTKYLRHKLAELPGLDFGGRAPILAVLHPRSRLRDEDMLVLRPSMLKALRESRFDELIVRLAAVEDGFAQDLKNDGCFVSEGPKSIPNDTENANDLLYAYSQLMHKRTVSRRVPVATSIPAEGMA